MLDLHRHKYLEVIENHRKYWKVIPKVLYPTENDWRGRNKNGEGLRS